MTFLLYLIFTVSGAAGLMYESIWSRYLGLFVGHSAYAQIIVLVIFLGGMSLGALVAGRRTERLAQPLLWYAGIELAVGLIGLVFHDVFTGVTRLAYDSIFPALPAGGVALTTVKWLLAALLILPQSVLLGATFPLMSAGTLRRVRRAPGRVLSLLYFANSIGAAGGVLLAGFYFIDVAGLPGTLLAAAIANFVAALAVYGIARWAPVDDATADAPAPHPIEGSAVPPRIQHASERAEERHRSDVERTESAASRTPATRRLWRALLLVSFGTAVASFVYEIAWIRMLSLVVGSATHSFEIMLSAFILGLSLGALWVRTRADRFADPVRALAITQCVMGALAIATLPVYVASFGWMVALMDTLGRTENAYRVFAIARYLLCLAVMLPATFCAGVTLPLITRILLGRGVGERAIGQVYAVNTLGSIVGASLAGLVLMPLLGLKALLVVGALVDIVFGLYLLAGGAGGSGHADDTATDARPAPERPPYLVPAALITVGLVLAVAVNTTFDPALLTSGVYRYGRLPDLSRIAVDFHRDGRTATVSVRREVGGKTITLATNGKPDASLSTDWIRPALGDTARRPLDGDQTTQALLPIVTLAHVPDARSGAVIGQGSGMSSHLLLGSPRLERLATIDIEPEMIAGSRAFYPANRRVFDDPRSQFVTDDAKSFFASGRRRFDFILSEPSNPWVSGVSGLFTREFYQQVRTYLTPDGVFGQWLHLYEIDDRLVLTVLAALHESFPSYQIYLVSTGDVLIVASNRPELPVPDWSVLALPDIAADLRRTSPLSASALDGTRLIDRATLAPLLDGWRGANSDFFPTLDLGAERTRFMRQSAAGFNSLSEQRFDLAATLAGRRVGFSSELRSPATLARLNALARAARLRQLARPLADGSNGALALGDTMLANTAVGDRDTRDAVYRMETLRAVLATAGPPADWPRFVRHALDVERDLHGGTAGVADEAFYAPVLGYMRSRGAPPGAEAALRFMHGLAAWDFAEAVAAAELLIAAQQRDAPWIAADLLHDGAVVSALRLGDPALARRLFEQTAARSGRGSDDLLSRLLAAHVAAAQR